MENPHKALASIRRLLEISAGRPPLEQAGAFAATKAILRELRDYLDAGHAGPVGVIVDEKMIVLNTHLDGFFGMNEDNGHDSHQHHIWALQAIDVLEDKIPRDS